MQISQNEYLEYQESYYGFCVKCDGFTRDCTEPDAREYDCPDCDQNTVCGAAEALLMGLIEFI